MLDFGILISPFKLKLLWCDWFSVSYPNRITKSPQDWPEAQEFHQNSIWYLKVLISTNFVIDVECTFEFDIDILKYRYIEISSNNTWSKMYQVFSSRQVKREFWVTQHHKWKWEQSLIWWLRYCCGFTYSWRFGTQECIQTLNYWCELSHHNPQISFCWCVCWCSSSPLVNWLFAYKPPSQSWFLLLDMLEL